MTINDIIKKAMQQEVKTGKMGNGNPCNYQRFIDGENEFTLVNGFLYWGVSYFDGEKDTYSTVVHIKEDRRDDNLVKNGVKTKFAGLIANSVIDENNFFNTCGLVEI